MLLHFKKSNEIVETWSPHCKNLAFKDPQSLNFHNRTDASVYTVHGSPKAVFCYYLASIRKEFQAALYTVRVVTIEELI